MEISLWMPNMILISFTSQQFQNSWWHEIQQIWTSKISVNMNSKYTYCFKKIPFIVFDAAWQTWFGFFGEVRLRIISPQSQAFHKLRTTWTMWEQVISYRATDGLRVSISSTLFSSVNISSVPVWSRCHHSASWSIVKCSLTVYSTILCTTCILSVAANKQEDQSVF